MTDSVLREQTGTVATITINRPAARNALTAETKLGLLDALRDCSGDDGVRAVVLTGAGRAFCAGQDLREHAEQLEAGGAVSDTVREYYNPMVAAITAMPKPVIAAINGVAAGAGAALALACDFRIAAQRASLLMAFARVGLGADSGASWTLQRLVGMARAAELLMLAEPVEAGPALSMGLLTSVVADEERRLKAGLGRLDEHDPPVAGAMPAHDEAVPLHPVDDAGCARHRNVQFVRQDAHRLRSLRLQGAEDAEMDQAQRTLMPALEGAGSIARRPRFGAVDFLPDLPADEERHERERHVRAHQRGKTRRE